MKSECEKTGWVKLYRCTMESTLWRNEKYLKVFCWCLMKANREDKSIIFNGADITIKRGQFVTGYKEALHELRPCTRQTYRSALTYLKSTNRINQQATNKFTIITVCNYDLYQSRENNKNHQNQPTSNNPVTNQQPTSNHKQEYKELKKNDKNPKGENNFFESLILLFKEVYEEVNALPYAVNMKKDLPAVTEVVKQYLGGKEITDEAEFKNIMEGYFRQVINHPDKFQKGHMTLSYLANNFNTINNTYQNGKQHGATDKELVELIFGKGKPEIPPTLNDVKQYFTSNEYTEQAAEIAFNQFQKWNWKGLDGISFISQWMLRAKELYFTGGIYYKPEYREKLMMP